MLDPVWCWCHDDEGMNGRVEGRMIEMEVTTKVVVEGDDDEMDLGTDATLR